MLVSLLPFDAESALVFFLDLLKNYSNILPPTIAKKQRESERRVPVRKRTAPVDMRMSRGRISVGTPTREILAAQQAAQELASSSVQNDEVVPPSPPMTRAEESATVVGEQQSIETHPPEHAPEPAAQEDNTAPPRPIFKEPFSDAEDTPPRPTFREPPPEADDAPLTRPTFVSPPASPPVEDKPTPSPAVAVTPATPQNPIKSLRKNSAFRSASSSPAQARSPSPSVTAGGESAAEDQPLTTAKSGLTRHTSGQGAVRGPRLSRTPRSQQGSSVSNMIASLNNRSSAASPPPTPGYKRLSGGTPRVPPSGGGDTKRVGRTSGGLSRRTMASDAEDEVVNK